MIPTSFSTSSFVARIKRRCYAESFPSPDFKSGLLEYGLKLCDFKVSTKFIPGEWIRKHSVFFIANVGLERYLYVPRNPKNGELQFEMQAPSTKLSFKRNYPHIDVYPVCKDKAGEWIFVTDDKSPLMPEKHEDRINIQKPISVSDIVIQQLDVQKSGANYQVTMAEEDCVGTSLLMHLYIFEFTTKELESFNAMKHLRGQLVPMTLCKGVFMDPDIIYVNEYLDSMGHNNSVVPFLGGTTGMKVNFSSPLTFDCFFTSSDPDFKLTIARGYPNWISHWATTEFYPNFPAIKCSESNKVFTPTQVLDKILAYTPRYLLDIQRNPRLLKNKFNEEWNCVLLNDLNMLRILQSRYCMYSQMKRVPVTRLFQTDVVKLITQTEVPGLIPVRSDCPQGKYGWIKQEADGMGYGRFDVTTFKFVCMFSRMKRISKMISQLKEFDSDKNSKKKPFIDIETCTHETKGAINNYLVYLWSMLLISDSLFIGKDAKPDIWCQATATMLYPFKLKPTPADISFPVMNRNGGRLIYDETTKLYREIAGPVAHKWGFRDVLYTLDFIEKLPLMRVNGTAKALLGGRLNSNRQLIISSIRRHIDAFLVSAVVAGRSSLLRVDFDSSTPMDDVYFTSLVDGRTWTREELRVKDPNFVLRTESYPSHVQERQMAKLRCGTFSPQVLGLGWGAYSVKKQKLKANEQHLYVSSIPRFRGNTKEIPKVHTVDQIQKATVEVRDGMEWTNFYKEEF
jgi:hypothetical protein